MITHVGRLALDITYKDMHATHTNHKKKWKENLPVKTKGEGKCRGKKNEKVGCPHPTLFITEIGGCQVIEPQRV